MEHENLVQEETVYNCSYNQALTVLPEDLFCRLLNGYDNIWARKKFGYYKIIDEKQWDNDGKPCRLKEPGLTSVNEFIQCAIFCHRQLSTWGYHELHNKLKARCENQCLLVGNKYPSNIDEVISSLKCERLMKIARSNLLGYFALVHIIAGNCVTNTADCLSRDWVKVATNRFLTHYKASLPLLRSNKKHCLEKIPYDSAAKDVRQRIARLQDSNFGCSFRIKKLRESTNVALWKKVVLAVPDRHGFVIKGWIRYPGGEHQMKTYYQTSINDVVLAARRNIVDCKHLIKEIKVCYLKEGGPGDEEEDESPSDKEEQEKDPPQEVVRTEAVIEKLPPVIHVPDNIGADESPSDEEEKEKDQAGESPSDEEEQEKDPPQEEVRTEAVVEKLPPVIHVPDNIGTDVEHKNEPAKYSNNMVSI